MKKFLLILGAGVTAVVTIMQFWLCIKIFINDSQCRTSFNLENSSIDNKMACINSLNSTSGWHCSCRFSGSYRNFVNPNENIDSWIKISNGISVYLASLHIFIPLVIIEFIRSVTIFCDGKECDSLGTFEYFSVLGFLAILLDPAKFDKEIVMYRSEVALILIDISCICLVFQYTSIIKVQITDPFFLVTLIASCCNIIRCILIIYLLNLQRHLQKTIMHPPAYNILDKV
jgi:hypothetical protein